MKTFIIISDSHFRTGAVGRVERLFPENDFIVHLGDRYTNDNPINYFNNGNAKSIMHPKTAALLESWLKMLQEEGEKKTFAHIKSLKHTNGERTIT